jgi:hypothetical protein
MPRWRLFTEDRTMFGVERSPLDLTDSILRVNRRIDELNRALLRSNIAFDPDSPDADEDVVGDLEKVLWQYAFGNPPAHPITIMDEFFETLPAPGSLIPE